jgi:hypothetical protein
MIRKAAWPLVLAAGMALLGSGAAGGADQPAAPRVVSANPAELAAVKAKVTAGAGPLRPAPDRLARNAERALRQRPVSVLERPPATESLRT